MNSVNNLKIAVDMIPPATYTRPPDVVTDLQPMHTQYNSRYFTVLLPIIDKNMSIDRNTKALAMFEALF